ncbi:MAG: hypothetical protein ACLFWR_02620 [Acidimicrobiales bacterium]
MTEPDRGSVLLLFPAAFMIVLVLGALAIDAAAVFLDQRELAAAAGAAANDAATLGLAHKRLRHDGELWLDPVRVTEAVEASLDRRGVLDSLLEPPEIVVLGGSRVEVTLVAHADYVIAPALPGDRSGRTVRATVGADAVLDDG